MLQNMNWRFAWRVMYHLDNGKIGFKLACQLLEAAGANPLLAWLMAARTLNEGYSPNRNWP